MDAESEMIAILAGSVLLLITCLALLLRKIASPEVDLILWDTWIDELSVDHYRPMMRILDIKDFDVCRGKPGFSRRRLMQLRFSRCRIFRIYLGLLQTDFQRICMAIKILMVDSDQDRPDLAATLLKTQARFAVGLAMVHVHLSFYLLGLGSVSIAPLLNCFDGVRLELQRLAPAQAGAQSY
jgi:hypothetical protein